MADDTTKLTISIETILRGLDKTLRGLSQVEKQLKRVASVTVGAQGTASLNRAAIAAQRLQLQQQRLVVQTQELANRQERARQTTERLALAQRRLEDAQQRVARTSQVTTRAFNRQQDAHVRDFRRQINAQDDLNRHVQDFRRLTSEAGRAVSRQADAHVRDFRRMQGAQNDLNAHVRDFRRLQQQAADTTRQLQQTLLSVGNALRSVGQGLASLGATLSVALTAPLAGIGVASVDAAVRLDSLKRGLAAIVGSSDEANRQLARLTQIAKLPGIGFEEAIQGSIRLQAVGFSAADAEKNLREFSNAVALTGGGRDELARVTVQLGQLAAKGKVLSQDLRPIIEAAPAVGRALLQAFGTVNAADIQELGLSSKEFLNVLTDELSRLPRAAAGAKNSFENFRDEVFRAAAAVGEVLLPALTRFVEVVGPVIVSLANAFAALPAPLQVVVVGIAALLAGLGPVLFVVGQLTLGVGRLLVGFVELNVAGILPTIASLRALTAGTLSAAAAQRTLAASSALVVGTVGGIAAILVGIVAAYAIYNAFQKDAVTLSKERAGQLAGEIKSLEEQAKFLNGLGAGVERTADEQERLSDIYDKLNTQAKIRVAGITDEEKRLLALRAELEKVIELRGQERIQQAANVAAQIAASAATIAANEQGRLSIAERIAANNALVETLEREGRITEVTRRELERLGQSTSVDVVRAIQNLQEQSARLVNRQKELADNTKETQDELNDYLATLRLLDPQHQLTARQLLLLARNMGLFKGDIEQMVPVLEKYIQKTDEAAKSTDAFNRSLSENERRLNEAGDRADNAAKARRRLIESAAAVARETSVDFAGALKSLRQMVDAVPELRAALKREGELTGKSLEELLQGALESAFKGRTKDKSGTGLRNAQEQLAKALSDVALASADAQVKIENAKNERLIDAAESGQRQQLISYRQFLELRSQLTADNLDREIAQQQAAVTEAKRRQAGLLLAAKKSGIPQAESVRRQAQAADAQEEAIKAETKLQELQLQRENITGILNQLIAESQHQQLADVRQLEIRYAELQGRIEDALNAATVEEFRTSLTDLSKAQDFLNRQLEAATKARDAERVAQVKQAQAQNQRQIEAIRNIVIQQQAANRLAGVLNVLERAKQRQSDLEDQITNDVELRGLSEEEAISRRLSGERELREELVRQRDQVEAVALALFDAGRRVPSALTEFISQTDIAIDRLGRLTFSEQFRLAEKEFTRLNDLRLQKIADVERAVRNRDIAEAEGLLLIRRINGEYVGDLERQLELLKSIAAASGDPALQRQAQDAAETAKDAADNLASLNRQIRATSIDAIQDGFTDFFKSLTDRTKTAKEKLLDLVNSIAERIEGVIAENLSRRLVESLFGGAEGQVGGFIASIKRLFGFGGGGGKAAGVVTDVAGKATLQTGAVAAATTLQTGATAAAATTATSAITFSTAVTTAATTFAGIIATAGAAFAAAVAAAAGAQTVGSVAGAAGSGIGDFATGDILPARAGGRLINVAEAGHAEAVLTTDPRHAVRQARILTRFLKMTKGLGGKFNVPQLASGALVTPRQTELNMLSGITRAPLVNSSLSNARLAAAGGGTVRLRQVLTDERDVGNWLNSSEGERVFRDKLMRNRPLIRDLSGGRV
jgi:tape measure domain-containing protein